MALLGRIQVVLKSQLLQTGSQTRRYIRIQTCTHGSPSTANRMDVNSVTSVHGSRFGRPQTLTHTHNASSPDCARTAQHGWTDPVVSLADSYTGTQNNHARLSTYGPNIHTHMHSDEGITENFLFIFAWQTSLIWRNLTLIGKAILVVFPRFCVPKTELTTCQELGNSINRGTIWPYTYISIWSSTLTQQ